MILFLLACQHHAAPALPAEDWVAWRDEVHGARLTVPPGYDPAVGGFDLGAAVGAHPGILGPISLLPLDEAIIDRSGCWIGDGDEVRTQWTERNAYVWCMTDARSYGMSQVRSELHYVTLVNDARLVLTYAVSWVTADEIVDDCDEPRPEDPAACARGKWIPERDLVGVEAILDSLVVVAP